MRIYSMTATFGKLENQTLTLQPGLNIISAPNEWGKSTWCTFLATMLYGLDTREKTTKTTLAVKERYAPWSGSPMSGRIDLNWNGRDITIERWTKGRTMLGEFRAYETENGLAIPELTGSNCGEVLLGVEKSVYLRSAFLRLSDLPVTADESLRRRLNALVTTGDESGAGDALAQKLKDLKNKVRYNRSGLLPQAEEQRRELESKLAELQTLQTQLKQFSVRQQEIAEQTAALENHLRHLQYAAAQADLERVEQAQQAAVAAAERMAKLEEACAQLPSREDAVQQLHRHAQLVQAQSALLQEMGSLPPEPSQPQTPARYQGLSPAQAVARADEDMKQYAILELSKKKNNLLWPCFGIGTLLLLLLAALIGGGMWIAAGILITLAAMSIFVIIKLRSNRIQKQLQAIANRYPGISPQQWLDDAQFYAETQRQYHIAQQNALSLRRSLRQRIEENETAIGLLTAHRSSQEFMLHCNQIIATHDDLADARGDHQQAAAHAETLQAMRRPMEKPERPDCLTLSEEESRRTLSDFDFEQKQLQRLLGQHQGRMESLGSPLALEHQLRAVNARIQQLNRYYDALELAQKTLTDASDQLQRRFAPRITEQARQLFSTLTDGRYDRLQLQQDLTVNAAAESDTTVRSVQWRSEGTVDQLYLALRLAVAKELTPEAPLVLDDVLVRFDDQRHAAAMKLLQEEAQQRQILLFTCQAREEAYSL